MMSEIEHELRRRAPSTDPLPGLPDGMAIRGSPSGSLSAGQ